MTEEETITITKTQLWQGVSGVLVLALALVVFAGLPSGADSTATGNNPSPAAPGGDAPQPNQPQAESVGEVEVDPDRDPILGDVDAPVTLVKFTDFGCVFCGRFYDETQGQLVSEYVESGDLRIVYKDSPITQLHPQAPNAHSAANCVFEQAGHEAYYEYVSTVYANQGQFSDSNVVQWAEDLGHDIQECYDTDDRTKIDEDLALAESTGFQGTPHFVLEGEVIRGAQPFNAFQQAINAELS